MVSPSKGSVSKFNESTKNAVPDLWQPEMLTLLYHPLEKSMWRMELRQDSPRESQGEKSLVPAPGHNLHTLLLSKPSLGQVHRDSLTCP